MHHLAAHRTSDQILTSHHLGFQDDGFSLTAPPRLMLPPESLRLIRAFITTTPVASRSAHNIEIPATMTSLRIRPMA